MAIVKEIKTGTADVKNDDRCFSGLSREALAERWAEVRRAILQIDREGGARNGRAGEAGEAREGYQGVGVLYSTRQYVWE